VAIDTLFVYCGVYSDATDAVDDYEAVKDVHAKENLMDSYDAVVIERDQKRNVKIVGVSYGWW
jgi:hypothetical protein